ncbi:MAG: SGNH/GDSL hydrolase family protein [Candidatus Brocadiia bacterium]
MYRPPSLALAALLLGLAAAAHGREASRVVLACDFERRPAEDGWHLAAHPGQEPEGEWVDSASVSGRHALAVSAGWWASPRLEVEPLRYYRLRFHAMVESKAYWNVQFFDADGELLAADHYSSIYPGDEWRPYDVCFRARHEAAAAEVRFQVISAPLYVDDASVEAISRAEAARWADQVALEIPPLPRFDLPSPDERLARSLARLRDGKRLRLVFLGDSIMNDIASSPFDVLLERAYPGARLEVVHSVRGGTGCPYYRQEGRVDSYVLAHQPHLLVVGGISNDHDPESVRDVIRQVRAKSDPDILVLSGAVSTEADLRAAVARLPEARQREVLERAKRYRPRLRRMAEEEKVAYFDLRAYWDAYVAHIRKHPEWLRRDRPHANTRGRQVLARLLAAYLGPPPAVSR